MPIEVLCGVIFTCNRERTKFSAQLPLGAVTIRFADGRYQGFYNGEVVTWSSPPESLTCAAEMLLDHVRSRANRFLNGFRDPEGPVYISKKSGLAVRVSSGSQPYMGQPCVQVRGASTGTKELLMTVADLELECVLLETP